MATTSEVIKGLDDIATIINSCRSRFTTAKNAIQGCSDQLGDIPTTYADVISTINGYTPTGAFETLAQDKRSKLQTEFVALKSDIDNLIAEF